ncbi:helix-turn-helix domain-containing protein [Halalkalicoccus sp. NIPERK01]|uniref:helix-turn-helix domain-containing protein n=1 Tax=Halalkalicoccus sp. NIPERK01 TaxID=3053469 RepID=UPI00256F0BF2|nr:helix-turn-helix domain-containing protein [Halalkalicoccus sp. NIPERK01]MDL5360892.1 helix-turn-helix domain-containing protein [Halalkalicoccus sp. NIPERK01]
MAIRVGVSLSAEAFALSETFRSHPTLDCTVEPVVGHPEGWSVGLVWFDTGDETIDATLKADPSVERADPITDDDGKRLYRLWWAESAREALSVLAGESGTILRAHASDGRWRFRVLFPERETASRAHERAEDAGIELDITHVASVEANRTRRYGLTEDQRTTLLAAIERGYYDIPRTVTMGEFASELDISHQALSERLRRAHRTLVESTLLSDDLD